MEGRVLYAIRNTQYGLRFAHHVSRFTFHVLIPLLFAPLALASPTPIFTDVTAEAGIDFKHTNGRSGEFYFVEQLGSGTAFFDYDNDGDLDIYFVDGADLPGFQSEHPPTNRLYRNNGDGAFTDVTEIAGVGDKSYGVGCCVGDYDNDGHLDLYVTNFGNNRLYRNNGDGTFTDIADRANVADERWGASCAFADYDNDGHLDLYVTNYIQYQLDKNKICKNKGVRTYCNPQEYVGEADILYRSNGDGTYTEVTQAAGVYQPRSRGLGIVWGDYDSDGYIDLYVANDTNENHLFHNNGDGSFSDMAFFAGVALNENGEMGSGMGVDFGDYNNDSRLDIMVTNFQDEVATLYHNDGDGFFSDASYISGTGESTYASLGWGVCFFDYDNDGAKDIFVANGHIFGNVEEFNPETTYAQVNHLFRNLGAGVFQEITANAGLDLSQKAPSRGAAFGDYDNDGDIDILVTNSDGQPQLLRNDGGNRNNWVKVHIRGTTSNRAGIGTRVEVVTGDVSQMAEVKSGSGYLCQNALALHFGLGGHTTIDKIIATFPSGRVHKMEAVPVNQIVEIIEPNGR